jgi:hypothetical protein
MKALTIKNPWAMLIALGVKDIENRTWRTNFRGRIYIHAALKPVPFNGMLNGMSFTQAQLKDVFKLNLPERYPDHMSKYPNACIVGEVDIIDCIKDHPSVWAERPEEYDPDIHEHVPVIWNWVLANPVLYDKPIENVKGKLSFWEYKR